MRENIEKYIELIIGSILLSLGIYLFVTPNGINLVVPLVLHRLLSILL